MDRREPIPMSNSPYYIQRGSMSELHGPPQQQQTIHHPMQNSNMSFQPNVGGTTSSGAGLMADPTTHTHAQPIPAEVSMSNSSGQAAVAGAAATLGVRRKRGRPRKYGPDGSVSLALSSPSPAAATTGSVLVKRGRGRPPGSGKKQQQQQRQHHISASGIVAAAAAAAASTEITSLTGAGFTPHVITIAAGEDIGGKILSFARQGGGGGENRGVCVMAVSGSVSSVTLRQASSSGGMATITYEGRFDILHMSGSFVVAPDRNGTSQAAQVQARAEGGLSISLVSPDGRVIGGGVGGMLVAASPVQVILGSFFEAKVKTKHNKAAGRQAASAAAALSRGTGGLEEMEHDNTATVYQQQRSQTQTPSSSSLGGGSGWASPQGVDDTHNSHFDIDLMHG